MMVSITLFMFVCHSFLIADVNRSCGSRETRADNEDECWNRLKAERRRKGIVSVGGAREGGKRGSVGG